MGFPMEIIREILLKAPPKSLVRFKSLSRSLCNLIESPDFIRSSSILLIYEPSLVIEELNLSTRRLEIADQPSVSDRYLKFVCCSDGLLCYRICRCRFDCDCGYRLWNPVTRLSVAIPACKDKASAFGIGVVGPENTIKLVLLSKFRAKAHVLDAGRRELSSWSPLALDQRSIELRETEIPVPDDPERIELSSWREIEIPFRMPRTACGGEPLRLNTALHWLLKSKTKTKSITKFNHCRQWILSFDLVTEVVTQISMPPSMAWSEDTSTVLVAFKGQLGFFDRKCETKFDLWVMKEYGESKSWTISHSIQDLPRLERPLQIWNDCHILIRVKPPSGRQDSVLRLYDSDNGTPSGDQNFGLLLYDLDKGTTREIDRHRTNRWMEFLQVKICNYKESLI